MRSKARLIRVTFLLFSTACFTAAFSGCSAAEEATELEEPLCFGFLERKLFEVWRDIAERQGRMPKDAPGIKFEELSLPTRDDRRLYGYMSYASGSSSRTLPAVLIAPGNAMLADQLSEFAAYFARRGMTAYVFDYRGYGGSTGRPFARAIIDDYKSILDTISDDHPSYFIYAMSFGGIVVLNALADTAQPDSLVLDGVPSALPWYAFCPDSLDPIANLDAAPEQTLVLVGKGDPVVPPEQSKDLLEEGSSRGFQHEILEGFSHPGLDSESVTQERLEHVYDYFDPTAARE